MKKALVILLAVAMMFCFSATAFAANFNDTADCSKEAQNAINKVAALGIVAGYDDGGYHPGDSITRAEFAKMADVTAGLEDAARDLQDVQSQFKDVKTSVWYTGWINLASAQGYVVGYEDNTYRPNNTISYAEVVTVAMRLLGYNANLTGPWPINYINQATKLGVLDDVENFSANAPATRSDVAIILSAALDENMVKWVSDDNEFVEKTKKVDGKDVTYTLLEDSFDGQTVSGTVDEVNVTDAENMEYQVGVGDDNFDADADTAVAGADINLLVGREVTVIYDEDNYANYIQVDDEIIEVAEAEDATADSKFKLDGKTYTKAAGAEVNKFDSDDTNVTGYALINSDNEVVKANTDAELGAELFGTYVIVTDVDTDDEDDYTVSVYDNYAKKDNATTIKADADDTIFMKNGVRVAATDIKAGDILVKGYLDPDAQEESKKYVRVAATDIKAGDILVKGYLDPDAQEESKKYVEKIYNVVSNPAITGEVIDGEASDTTVKIGDKEYTYAKNAYTEFDGDYDKQDSITPWIDLYEDTVSIYLGADNAIAYVINDNEAVADNYAILLNKTQSYDAFEGKYTTDSVTVFTKEGKTVTLTLSDDLSDEDQKLFDAYYEGEDKPAKLVKGSVFKYSLDDAGEIDAANINGLAAADYKTNSKYAGVSDNNKYIVLGQDAQNTTNYTIASDAVLFNLKDDYEASLMTASQVLANDGAITSEAVDDDGVNYIYVVLNEDGDEVEFMAVTNFGGSDSVDYAVIDSVTDKNASTKYIKFQGDSTKYEIANDVLNGQNAGALVSYEVSGGKVTDLDPVEQFEDGKEYTLSGFAADYIKLKDGDSNVGTFDLADDCVYVTYDESLEKPYELSTADKVLKVDRTVKYVYDKDDAEVTLVVYVK
jgi:hypothetical protein